MPVIDKIFCLIAIIAACSANKSATMANFQKVIDAKTARTLDCRNDEYALVMAENVNIVVGDEVLSRIELPKESEVKNFSLNSIEKTKAGFDIKTDWGGSLDHYEIQFNFRCKGKNFYLYRVKKISFSTTNPDSGNFWNKQKSKVTKIVPNLPIEKFVMTDYL